SCSNRRAQRRPHEGQGRSEISLHPILAPLLNTPLSQAPITFLTAADQEDEFVGRRNFIRHWQFQWRISAYGAYCPLALIGRHPQGTAWLLDNRSVHAGTIRALNETPVLAIRPAPAIA